ncbi:MAG: 50S ribosomal protein L21, partial [Actinomycetota bacterium]|nr:50S ribosomal protein L21 [Actinomycetota bacterium]
MTYAIIAIGGKQYRVHEGERLLVDRLPIDEGATFHPDVLLLGGDGEARLGPDDLDGEQVTARVAAHVLGAKVIVGKHRRRTGYRRRKGHR